MGALVDIRNHEVRFGAVDAVRGVSLSVDEGEVLGRVAVMRRGEVVETGECGHVLAAPQHAYTRTLLAAVPTLRTSRERPLAVAER
jgi:ABC-type dipeptide/oligopeptide/nickel transport system ATPase component